MYLFEEMNDKIRELPICFFVAPLWPDTPRPLRLKLNITQHCYVKRIKARRLMMKKDLNKCQITLN
jgi:hypothetical protein